MKGETVDDAPWWYRSALPFSTVGDAVDNYLSNLESMAIALSQRPLSEEQRDRYAAILLRAQRDVLRRTVA